MDCRQSRLDARDPQRSKEQIGIPQIANSEAEQFSLRQHLPKTTLTSATLPYSQAHPHNPPVPPDIQAPHHALRAPLGSGGGVISSEHPSVAKT